MSIDSGSDDNCGDDGGSEDGDDSGSSKNSDVIVEMVEVVVVLVNNKRPEIKALWNTLCRIRRQEKEEAPTM